MGSRPQGGPSGGFARQCCWAGSSGQYGSLPVDQAMSQRGDGPGTPRGAGSFFAPDRSCLFSEGKDVDFSKDSTTTKNDSGGSRYAAHLRTPSDAEGIPGKRL